MLSYDEKIIEQVVINTDDPAVTNSWHRIKKDLHCTQPIDVQQLKAEIAALVSSVNTTAFNTRHEERPAENKVAEQISTNIGSPKSAIEIVERLAAWCNRYPKSSTPPDASIVEFHEIERAANEFVNSGLRAGD